MAPSASNRIVSEPFALALALGLACFVSPAAARADAKECISHNEKGNALRQAGKLSLSREEFVACAVDSCPKMIREECANLLTQVNKAIPSLVFAAKDRTGKDTTKVRVRIDGRDVATNLDGRGIPVDPGEHAIVLTAEDGTNLELTIVAREGESNRRVDVEFAEPKQEPTDEPSSLPPPPPVHDEPPKSGPPAAAWILGGVGVVALGGFVYFALDGKSKENDLESNCAPNCSESDVDSMRKSYLFADVALGVSVISLGAMTYLFVSSGSSKPKAGLSVPSLRAGRSSLGVGWGGQF